MLFFPHCISKRNTTAGHNWASRIRLAPPTYKPPPSHSNLCPSKTYIIYGIYNRFTHAFHRRNSSVTARAHAKWICKHLLRPKRPLRIMWYFECGGPNAKRFYLIICVRAHGLLCVCLFVWVVHATHMLYVHRCNANVRWRADIQKPNARLSDAPKNKPPRCFDMAKMRSGGRWEQRPSWTKGTARRPTIWRRREFGLRVCSLSLCSWLGGRFHRNFAKIKQRRFTYTHTHA